MFCMMGTFFLLCVLIMVLLKPQRPKTFPPGPMPVPVFENVQQLSMWNPDLDKVWYGHHDSRAQESCQIESVYTIKVVDTVCCVCLAVCIV